MKNVAYTGSSDARHLDAADLSKAGVDLSNAKDQEFIFQRKVAKQVTNEVAEALVANPHLFGNFEEVETVEGQRIDNQEELDFSAIEDKDKPATEPGEVLDTPQTGIDSAPAAPRKSSTRATS